MKHKISKDILPHVNLENVADNLYAKQTNGFEQIHENNKAKGLDINDPASIEAFESGYTPLGNTILVLEIHKEQKVGLIIMPDMLADGKQCVAITPGLLVNNVYKGDILSFKRDEASKWPPYEVRVLKGIELHEYSYHAFGGVFITSKEMKNRIATQDKAYKEKNEVVHKIQILPNPIEIWKNVPKENIIVSDVDPTADKNNRGGNNMEIFANSFKEEEANKVWDLTKDDIQTRTPEEMEELRKNPNYKIYCEGKHPKEDTSHDNTREMIIYKDSEGRLQELPYGTSGLIRNPNGENNWIKTKE